MKAALLALLSTFAVHASTIAYNDPAAQGTQIFPGNLALLFHVNDPITVTSLGVFNANGSGTIAGTIQVAIWNTDLNIQVTPTVTFHGSYTPAGFGFDVFQSIAPIILGIGNYEVDAVGFNSLDLNGNKQTGSSTGTTLNSGGGVLTFTAAAFDNSTSLDGPTSCIGCLTGPANINQFDAGTFTFTGAPEPGAFTACAFGLIALSVLARRTVRGRRSA